MHLLTLPLCQDSPEHRNPLPGGAGAHLWQQLQARAKAEGLRMGPWGVCW